MAKRSRNDMYERVVARLKPSFRRVSLASDETFDPTSVGDEWVEVTKQRSGLNPFSDKTFYAPSASKKFSSVVQLNEFLGSPTCDAAVNTDTIEPDVVVKHIGPSPQETKAREIAMRMHVEHEYEKKILKAREDADYYKSESRIAKRLVEDERSQKKATEAKAEQLLKNMRHFCETTRAAIMKEVETERERFYAETQRVTELEAHVERLQRECLLRSMASTTPQPQLFDFKRM